MKIHVWIHKLGLFLFFSHPYGLNMPSGCPSLGEIRTLRCHAADSLSVTITLQGLSGLARYLPRYLSWHGSSLVLCLHFG